MIVETAAFGGVRGLNLLTMKVSEITLRPYGPYKKNGIS